MKEEIEKRLIVLKRELVTLPIHSDEFMKLLNVCKGLQNELNKLKMSTK